MFSGPLPRRLSLALVAGLVCASLCLGNATISLKAVKKNGIPIPATNAVAVQPGDRITAEIRIFGWSHPPFDWHEGTGQVSGYQVSFDILNGVWVGSRGTVLPRGYDCLPIFESGCPFCPPSYPICDPVFRCISDVCNPHEAASLDTSDPGYIFYDFPNMCYVYTDRTHIRWRCWMLDGGGEPDGNCVGGGNAGFPCGTPADCPLGICQMGIFYVGTLELVVSADACGIFVVSLDSDLSETYLLNPFLIPYSSTMESLVIYGPQCPPNSILSSDPPHCAIDARVPFTGAPASRQGFRSVDLTFDQRCGADEDSSDGYTVQQFPSSIPTVIQSVVTNGNTATITFTQPITTHRWTCVLHNASNTRACLGYLPGDVNGDRVPAPADILDLIDHLNGVLHPPLAIYQCDIDRSGLCAPADILTEIDVLNGLWGTCRDRTPCTIDACPSMHGP